MEAGNEWYKGIWRGISALKARLSPTGRRRHKLSLFVRAARKVTGFAADCEECRKLKSQINWLSEAPVPPAQMTPEEYRNYLTTHKSIIKHLRRRHGLVVEKQYIKRFVSIGAAFGLSLVMFGYVLLSFGITVLVLSITLPALIIRVLLGYAVGYLLDRRAKQQGRVI
ncbi:MAG TPA: hypothetical protein G4O09_04745 [Dehalococcoidia bacterium]|nr:hypothetical protein [Dehalococcoidia bacterium]